MLRENALANKNTQIVYTDTLPVAFNTELLQRVYGYIFELKKVDKASDITEFNGSTIYISEQETIDTIELNPCIDFYVNHNAQLGSVILVNGEHNNNYVSAIQTCKKKREYCYDASQLSDSFKTNNRYFFYCR